MNLVIDIGNSRMKTAVFRNGQIIEHRTASVNYDTVVRGLTEDFPDVRHAVVSSTRNDDCGICDVLRGCGIEVLEFGASTRVPLVNRYATPETLGRDRLAAAVGAAAKFPHRNIFIVDFGTAITQDIVSADGEFLGGSISPGLNTRLRALHEFTGTLPLVAPSDCRNCNPDAIPCSTHDAIITGVAGGIELEIAGRIECYSHRYPNLVTIFTGGDAELFEKRFKNTIFAEPDIVLAGLNTILEYNAL